MSILYRDETRKAIGNLLTDLELSLLVKEILVELKTRLQKRVKAFRKLNPKSNFQEELVVSLEQIDLEEFGSKLWLRINRVISEQSFVTEEFSNRTTSFYGTPLIPSNEKCWNKKKLEIYVKACVK